MQRTPETVKSVIVADKQSKSFHIALSVLKTTFDKDITTKAFIDGGASINCLDWGFVRVVWDVDRSFGPIDLGVDFLQPRGA